MSPKGKAKGEALRENRGPPGARSRSRSRSDQPAGEEGSRQRAAAPVAEVQEGQQPAEKEEEAEETAAHTETIAESLEVERGGAQRQPSPHVPGAVQAQSLMKKAVFDQPLAREHGPLDYKRGAALRYKFRIPAPEGELDQKHRQPPSWVGHHPKNRDGTRMSADRCEDLMEAVIGQFDPDEADHDSVCVAQAPNATNILFWTMGTCECQPTMANPVDHLLKDGSIGHSHMNQMLHNVCGGAVVTRPGLKRLTDASGRLSLALVRAADKEFAEYCVKGLAWERLSHQIEVEEPDGIILIQSLLNRKHDVQMVEHEMQVLSRLANIVHEFSRRMSGSISVEMAREKLAAEGMPQVAHSAEFPGVLSAVLQWGGATSTHFIRLKEFHERCVNAKLRRVRLSLFVALAGIDVAFPLTRNLCAEYAYSASPEKKQIEDGFCNKVKVSNIYVIRQSSRKPLLEAMELWLERFHNQYKEGGIYKELSANQVTTLMCKVDLMMATPLFLEKNVQVAKEQIDACAAKVEAALRATLAPAALQLLDKRFPAQAPRGEPTQACASGPPPESLVPKMITYDSEGRAQNRQDEALEVASKPPQKSEVQFLESLRNARDLQLKVGFLHALFLAHDDIGQTLRADVEVFRGAQGGNVDQGSRNPTVEVKVKRDFLKGELNLLPLVKDVHFIVAATSPLSPLAVETTLLTGDGAALSIIPCVQWGEKQQFLPPFWLVRRSKDSAEVNAEIKEITVSVLGECKVGRASEPGTTPSQRTTQRVDIRVPCMTNVSDLEAGAELIAYAKKEQKIVKKQHAKTWLDAAHATQKKK